MFLILDLGLNACKLQRHGHLLGLGFELKATNYASASPLPPWTSPASASHPLPSHLCLCLSLPTSRPRLPGSSPASALSPAPPFPGPAQPCPCHLPAYLNSAVSSLSQNGNQENPSCCGIDGILEAYHSSLRTVQLYGPTNFAPVVTHVAR